MSRSKADTEARAAQPGRPGDVLRLLAEMVEQDGIGVGDRLPPEVEIARRLGFGRSTIREALRQWESLGIIERNKGAGTHLIGEMTTRSLHLPLTLQIEAGSLKRMLAVRRPLEIEAARIAARVASPQARKQILARMAELMAVYEAGEDWRAADRRFHKEVHLATGNPLFQQIIERIHSGFHDIYDAPFGQPELGSETIPVHRDLGEAIAAGDEGRTVRIMESILDMLEADIDKVLGKTDG